MLLGSLLLSSCSNPETQKLRHLERGNQYAAEKRDEFAVVEYASAVKIDPKFGEARLKLARNLRADEQPAAPRSPSTSAPPTRCQTIATRSSRRRRCCCWRGRFEDAKARAAALLEKNPKDVEALLLHANAMAALRDPAGAIAQIEEALKISPDSSRAFVNLGAVRMQSGEAKEAEAAFRKAIALEPASVDARLALANFLWAAERAPEAEATLKEVLAKEPQHLLANRMLGVLYLSTRRVSEAEQPLKAVADISKTPAARFQLADYYVSVGRTEGRRSLLTALSSDPATFAEAEVRLAALDYAEGRVPEAHKRLDAVLARVPNYAPGARHEGAVAHEGKQARRGARSAPRPPLPPIRSRRPRISRWPSSTTAAEKWPMPSSRTTKCCGSTRARSPRRSSCPG